MLRCYRLYVLCILLPTLPAIASAECEPSPMMPLGTHYKPVKQEKIDVGTGLLVSGRILAMPDCRPIANAKITHWQAGADGRYADKLRAVLYSDAEGRYRFNTEWPAAEVPHIHFIVKADGHQAVATQWVGTDKQSQISFDIILEPATSAP